MENGILQIVITGLFTLFGGIIGALIAYWAQIRLTNISVFIPSRIEAYGKFEAAMKSATKGVTKVVAAEIYEAANAAYLVASDKTADAISEVQDFVRQAENGVAIDMDSFQAARLKLLVCMRNDLVIRHKQK